MSKLYLKNIQQEAGNTRVCLLIVYFKMRIYEGDLQVLVLGRKPGEYVVIDDKIKVAVIKSEDGHLRLAIDAPKEIKIKRGELYEEEQKLLNQI